MKMDACFECEGSVCGFIELDYSTGEVELKEFGMIIAGEATVKGDIQINIFYARVGIGGEIEIIPMIDKENDIFFF